MWDAFKVAIFSGSDETIRHSIKDLRESRHGWGSILSGLITTWCQHFARSGSHEVAAALLEAIRKPRDMTDDRMVRLCQAVSELPMTPATNTQPIEILAPPELPPKDILETVDPDLIRWVKTTFRRQTRGWVWSLLLQTGHSYELLKEYITGLYEECDARGLKQDLKGGVPQALWCIAKAKWSSPFIDVYEELFGFRITKTNRAQRLLLFEWVIGWDISDVPDIRQNIPEAQHDTNLESAYLFSVIQKTSPPQAPVQHPTPPQAPPQAPMPPQTRPIRHPEHPAEIKVVYISSSTRRSKKPSL